MKFAVANNMPVRGHVLVWHQQTPRWFFAEGYSTDAEAPLVSREKMLLRLENYIRKVMEYFQTTYPGAVYAWDVVNEAIEPGSRQVKGYRTDSLWYEVVGQDFIEQAFTFARKYADPGVKLFYNDYGEYVSNRLYRMEELVKELKEKDLIDGMGMQSHISMTDPNLLSYEDAIRRYSALGVEVHITELDINNTANDDETILNQGMRYARLSEIYRRLRGEGVNITNLTIWGITDNRSWLNSDGPKYPLLFDQYYNPKPAFYGLYDPGLFIALSR
jgi:endo-1,4-beta-xylanase